MIVPGNYSPQQLAVHAQLMSDLPYFCRNALMIKHRDASGELPPLIPIVFSESQWLLHDAFEDQIKRTGRIKKIIVKARQLYCSTLVAARFYREAIKYGGRNVFILSHEKDSTIELFDKVLTFLRYAPPTLTPGRPVQNRLSVKFDNESSYSLATAGTPEAGRAKFTHYHHGSECAFWPFFGRTRAALKPLISNSDGSAEILESTSNGAGTEWHAFVLKSKAGGTPYEVEFIPWNVMPEYTAVKPAGWEFDDEALELQQIYGLTDDQLYWRWEMVNSFPDKRFFYQEYPITLEESFLSVTDSLIDSLAVQRARKQPARFDDYAPLILGVDPAISASGDRIAIAWRKGEDIGRVDTYKADPMGVAGLSIMQLAGKIANHITQDGVDHVFLDAAIGMSVAQRLWELGFQNVTSVDFAESPMESQYANKRAEIAFALKQFIERPGTSIPDDDDIAIDLLSVPMASHTSTGKIKLQSKDVIKKTYGRSPDLFDAMALTFSYDVRSRKQQELEKMIYRPNNVPEKRPGSILDDFGQKTENSGSIRTDIHAWGIFGKDGIR